MTSVKHLANALRDFYEIERSSLVTEGHGHGSILIVPLHGLEKSRKPMTSHEKKFHEIFPGYISSRDGQTHAIYARPFPLHSQWSGSSFQC